MESSLQSVNDYEIMKNISLAISILKCSVVELFGDNTSI